ncbi:nuclear transport factor 2 family protein [Flavobacterium silvaticum]|uniref:Nuclear transport factor 2 family protein n=1 Tax=Flavobacterium silvaticum TaxID=1852020 RepID=A0A972FWC9_9FLAO|nr:nuclear transport factor 2 family protein [Flavobacterium silvaticum]NMH28850.1 nuclear transport factor 2 family protein [Flavobacterium silvaticum]
MSPKKFVQLFYKSDALIDGEVMEQFLHPEATIDWNSSRGLIQMDRAAIIQLATELGRAYMRSKVRISHILQEGNTVSVRYTHHIKTIENPREEILLANFMAIWEIKDDKLYRGYQMSQL